MWVVKKKVEGAKAPARQSNIARGHDPAAPVAVWKPSTVWELAMVTMLTTAANEDLYCFGGTYGDNLSPLWDMEISETAGYMETSVAAQMIDLVEAIQGTGERLFSGIPGPSVTEIARRTCQVRHQLERRGIQAGQPRDLQSYTPQELYLHVELDMQESYHRERQRAQATAALAARAGVRTPIAHGAASLSIARRTHTSPGQARTPSAAIAARAALPPPPAIQQAVAPSLNTQKTPVSVQQKTMLSTADAVSFWLDQAVEVIDMTGDD